MNLFEIAGTLAGVLMWISLCALMLGAAVFAFAGLRCTIHSLFLRLNPSAVCIFAIAATFATCEAQKRLLRNGRSAPAVIVAQEEIAQGWRLESVATNCAVSYLMPDGVSPTFNWHRRGTFGEWARLDLGDFSFPLGTNGESFTSFSVFNDARIRPTPRDAAREICAMGVPMLAMQGASRFWATDGTGGSKLLTWENFFLDADTNSPVNVQIELFENGDFTTRSNEVARVFRRVEPFDWDGDGLENSVDPEPLVAGPDAHGTNVEWYNVVCSNVFEAAEAAVPSTAHGNMSPPGIDLAPCSEDVNTNAYYFVEVVAEHGPAPIYFMADGESRLGNPIIVARAGETNHVPLLIGASYAVTSSVPFAVNVPAEGVEMTARNGGGFDVRQPVTFAFERTEGVAMQGSSVVYSYLASPASVGASLASVCGTCCVCEIGISNFTWTCVGECGCGGVGRFLEAQFSWEGYSAVSGLWGRCECGRQPSGGDGGGDPPPHLVFDMPSVFFTNNDGGAEMSDIVEVTVGLESPVVTNGLLTVNLLSFGTDQTVKAWATSNRTQRVNLPLSWDVMEMPMRRIYLEGAHVSGTFRDEFNVQWTDYLFDVRQELYKTANVYCPIAEPVNSSLHYGGDLCNPAGITTGTNACFAIDFAGETRPFESEIEWSVVEGSARFIGGNTGSRVRVASDAPGQCVRLRAQVGDCRSRPIEMKALVVEPLSVKTTVWIVGNRNGTYYARDASAVSNIMTDVNKIYEQIGVSFYIDSISLTNRYDWLNLKYSGSRIGYDIGKRRELANISKLTGGIELYFIDELARGKNANHDRYGIVVSTNGTATTVAHEIGHAFGLADIYPTRKQKPHWALPDPMLFAGHAPDDWSNGDGCRYYRMGLSQEDLIQRLMMCGFGVHGRYDLSFGMIYGYAADGVDGMINVGFFSGNNRRMPIFHW